VSWLLVALIAAGAPPPCAFEDRLNELRAAAKSSDPRLEQMQSRFESDIGRPLLREPERSIPPVSRVELIARRAKLACALTSQFSGAASHRADRDRLKEILDRPEFAGARTRNSEWLARWWRRLGEWFESLLEAEGAQSFANFTRALVLGLALAAAAAGFFRLARRATTASAGKPSTLPSIRERLENPAAHLSLAEAAVNTNSREAIRQALLALLSWLERRRLARPDRAKTNRELARELPDRGASAELSEAIGRLVHWYDRAFYSLSAVSTREAQHFIHEISALQSNAAGDTS
jgi:hypothetical protein